jgi:transposase-like protein
VVGVLPDGTKEILALAGGSRESTDSWLSLLLDLKRRGIPAPKLAIGDGDTHTATRRLTQTVRREARCIRPSYNMLYNMEMTQ